ncbi:MAG TPA: hypothetical protein VE326_10790 [Candidatus Binatia bacterium]|nr:hypothetical protein [Candidatus Binatia bacterium]
MRRTPLARFGIGAPLLALFAWGCAHAPGTPRASVAGVEESYGWHLLERRCQGCHALPDPRRHSRTRWVKGIEQMRGRFAMPASDWDTLLAMVPADTVSADPTREAPR